MDAVGTMQLTRTATATAIAAVSLTAARQLLRLIADTPEAPKGYARGLEPGEHARPDRRGATCDRFETKNEVTCDFATPARC
jgi:hypothetical protein